MEFALWVCVGGLAAWLIGRLDPDASVRGLCRDIGAGMLGAALGGLVGSLFTGPGPGPEELRVSGILGAEIGGIALAVFVHRRGRGREGSKEDSAPS